jgi:hypothetical protein
VSGLVDHAVIGRRLRRSLLLLGGATIVAWLIGGALAGGPTLARLAELLGVAVLLSLLIEVVIVGGAAVSAALRAGARGERLSADDVRLVPPQLRRIRRR